MVLDFGYHADSITTTSIPKEEFPEIYEFIDSEISNFYKELNVAFDCPFRLTFWNENKEGEGRWETELSKFKFSTMWVKTRAWPAAIKEIALSKFDYSKKMYIEVGPKNEFYKMLLAQPTAIDYGFEVSFAPAQTETDDRVYRNQLNAITPVYPGGFKELNKYLYTEIVKPVLDQNPKKAGLNLLYWISIDKEGRITEVKPNSNAASHQKQISLDIVKKIMEMPQWTPANRYGNSVKSIYSLHVKLKPYFYEHLLTVEIE